VSWADEVGGDLECAEKRLDYGKVTEAIAAPRCASPPQATDAEVDRATKGQLTREPQPLSSNSPQTIPLSISGTIMQSLDPHPCNGKLRPNDQPSIITVEATNLASVDSSCPRSDLRSPSSNDIPQNNADNGQSIPPVSGGQGGTLGPDNEGKASTDGLSNSKPTLVRFSVLHESNTL
jgi:hypothetical protein